MNFWACTRFLLFRANWRDALSWRPVQTSAASFQVSTTEHLDIKQKTDHTHTRQLAFSTSRCFTFMTWLSCWPELIIFSVQMVSTCSIQMLSGNRARRSILPRTGCKTQPSPKQPRTKSFTLQSAHRDSNIPKPRYSSTYLSSSSHCHWFRHKPKRIILPWKQPGVRPFQLHVHVELRRPTALEFSISDQVIYGYSLPWACLLALKQTVRHVSAQNCCRMCAPICSHMCPRICLLSHVCCHVCSDVSALIRSHMSAPMCSHMCVLIIITVIIIIIITTYSLVSFCPPTLFGVSCPDNIIFPVVKACFLEFYST